MAVAMMSPRSPRLDGKRATLSNFGSMIPRPQQQQPPPPPPSYVARCATARGQPTPAPSWLQVSAGAIFSPRTVQTAPAAGEIRAPVQKLVSAAPVVGPAVESAVPRLKLDQAPEEGVKPQPSPRLSPRQSPRMPNTARGDNRPLTLGTLGSLVPRAAVQSQASKPSSAFSQMFSPRLETRVIPDTSSGVVYERDGFECFYGVGGNDDAAIAVPNSEKQSEKREKRDGFDKFYGIRSSDRRPDKRQHGSDGNSGAAIPATGSSNAATPSQDACKGETSQGDDASRSHRLSAPSRNASSVPSLASVATLDSNSKARSSASLFKVNAPPPRTNAASGADGASKPGEVVMFSLSTPAAPGPSFTPAPVPGGVEVFRMSTPGPGSPS